MFSNSLQSSWHQYLSSRTPPHIQSNPLPHAPFPHIASLCHQMFTGHLLLVWATWRGLTLRRLVREWLLGQVRHAGNWSAVPEEGSCHVAGIRVVLVGRLNPCNGREGVKRGCWGWLLDHPGPWLVLWQSTGTFRSKRLVAAFLLSAPWWCVNHGKICNSFYTAYWCECW